MGKKCKVKLDVGTVYQKEEGGGAVWAFKKDNFTYEVHRRLAFGSYWNDVDYEGYFAAAFNRLTTGEGSRRYFTPEDHFIFLCFHLAKHLNSTGAGIRMVMDLALFLKAYQDTLDRDLLEGLVIVMMVPDKELEEDAERILQSIRIER